MLPAILHSLAFLIALNVQTMATPFAGAWLFFTLAGCCASLRRGFPLHNTAGELVGVWLVILGVSCFLLRPVPGAAATMWILAAAPMIALTSHPEDLKYYLRTFGAALVIFATGLVAQEILHMQYSFGGSGDNGRAWPMLDSNNAAAVIAAGILPAFYLTLKNFRWGPLLLLFCAALILTASKAGVMGASIGGIFILRYVYGRKWLLLFLLAPCVWIPADLYYRVISSFLTRLPVWEASMRLFVNPLSGLGLGSFIHYYMLVRTEQDTQGTFAHNDVLQIAVEMGIPAAAFFSVTVLAAISRMAIAVPAAAYALCLFLMSMLEFQFYVPAINILFGVALAYCCGVTSKSVIPLAAV